MDRRRGGAVILGVFSRDRAGARLREELARAAERRAPGGTSFPAAALQTPQLALWALPSPARPLASPAAIHTSEDGKISLALEGQIFNAAELGRSLGPGPRSTTGPAGEALVHLYESDPEHFLDRVNGTFAFALWDDRKQRLLLGRDRLGAEPLFYLHDPRRVVFGSSLTWMLAAGWTSRELDPDALLQYLLYGYNPGAPTLVRDVRALPPAHLLSVDGGTLSLARYWRLSFAEIRPRTLDTYRREVLELIEDAIRIRLDPAHPPGIFLSGGTDSSAIVSLTSRMVSEPLATFSFRCEGRSYDESSYARFMAERQGTRHTEVDYHAGRLDAILQAVAAMDEPFSDAGIEIATYLLGEAARDEVRYVFSGEGGDELFAGHPVYVADKAAAVVDRFPRALVRAVSGIVQRIPDSDQKKNLQVKLKRFAYSLAFPPALLSHRWRIYYTAEELRSLCADDLIGRADLGALWAGMLAINAETDGPDPLSRSLASDYQTLVGFYQKRLGLLRAFSLESRTPLLDHRLIEYAATIPSSLKIRGLSDTKYLYKKILRDVVPAKILYERPKLGHGVPMKNWLREDPRARSLLHDVLGGQAFRERGLFRADAIARMLDEHARKLHNHSHRLWTLVVLERWLETWLDAS
jgi:asparagine synthase (glutamine-hydrolysing)